MDDSIGIAVGWCRAKEIEPYLGLCVHPDNTAAIKLYQRAEFVALSVPFLTLPFSMCKVCGPQGTC
ncbi:MAG TPA: hypothetical protein PK867_30060, partial [Pirellulales bacterium]|nr:hypothetical protein [Pirellulales bacterium]